MHEAAVNDLCAHGYGVLTAKKAGAARMGRSRLSWVRCNVDARLGDELHVERGGELGGVVALAQLGLEVVVHE